MQREHYKFPLLQRTFSFNDDCYGKAGFSTPLDRNITLWLSLRVGLPPFTRSRNRQHRYQLWIHVLQFFPASVMKLEGLSWTLGQQQLCTYSAKHWRPYVRSNTAYLQHHPIFCHHSVAAGRWSPHYSDHVPAVWLLRMTCLTKTGNPQLFR